MPGSDSSSNAPAERARLIRILRQLAVHTPPEWRGRVEAIFDSALGPSKTIQADLRTIAVSPQYAKLVERLATAWDSIAGLEGPAVALAFSVACSELDREAPSLEIVWTGPASKIIVARHTSAVLFELIAEARNTLTLFSFATHSVAGFPQALSTARHRNVRIRLVLETQNDSGGKLSYDGSAALKALHGIAEFYAWPIDRRQIGAVMHAKTVLVDRRAAFITSANLTEYGIDRNLELGVLIRGGKVPRDLDDHVASLIETKEIVRVS